jgi:hypothetical protein
MPPTTAKEANLRLAGQMMIRFSTERCKPNGLQQLPLSCGEGSGERSKQSFTGYLFYVIKWSVCKTKQGSNEPTNYG